jgi:hypothetical protein
MAISTISQNGLNAPLSLTSPALTTPNLGTPSAIVLTNATSMPAAQLTGSRTIPIGTMPASTILQVQQTFFTTQGSTTANSFTDLMTLSFTPTSSSSKVLLMAQVMITSYQSELELRWARSGTAIGVGTASGSRVQASVTAFFPTADTNHNMSPFVMCYLDSPATTSAITYSVQIKGQTGGTMYYNRFGSFADNSDWATVSTSTLTAMEVAA